jgi:hypothetical protein
MLSDFSIMTFSHPESEFIERRGKPRLSCSYPAALRGRLPGGKRYEARAVLSNLSASGMYLRTKHVLRIGEQIFMVVRMATRPLGTETALQIAAIGVVVRVEAKVDGTYGVALRLRRYRFL